MAYRLGLDMGATSIGWALLVTDSKGEITGVEDMGVRIFSDGRDAKSHEPLAVTRRDARGARRRLDRRKQRVNILIKNLIQCGFLSKDEQERQDLKGLDPYALRAKGLDEKLTKEEVSRILIAMARRRGFKSNRKDQSKANEKGAINSGIASLKEALQESQSRTLGEYLYSKGDHGEKLARPKTEGNKNTYTIYPSRAMYEDELTQIFSKQQAYHPELTEDVIEKLKGIVLYQRPLKPQEVGKCTFEDGEIRAPKAHPLYQSFRALQDLNNLEINQFEADGVVLSKEDRDKIKKVLLTKKDLTFKGIRKLLKLPTHITFNFESEKREKLLGDSTSATFADKKCFGDAWYKLSEEEQDDIINRWLKDEDEAFFKADLMERYGLSEEQAKAVSDASLEAGYGNLSLKAIKKILPFLEEGLIYSEACQKAGYHHSDFRTGEVFDKGDLPYYGKLLQKHVIGGSFEEKDKKNPEKYYGKINNPTVHIALNQLKNLVNAITSTYGAIETCHIELARDLPKGTKELSALNKSQTKNQKENERIAEELLKANVKNTYQNRMKYKLWEDLAKDAKARACPFCAGDKAKVIGIKELFSSEYEIEHLIPFSRSYDDSRANKVIACQSCNRDKGAKTPYEAFGHMDKWQDILDRLPNLSEAKQRRFLPNAGEMKEDEEMQIPRQLTDTQYATRLARMYMSYVCGDNKVVSLNGRLTSLIRHHWGLNDILSEQNKKDRSNHYHHAIDAFVIACTDRSLIQHVSREAKKMLDSKDLYGKRAKLLQNINVPYVTYFNDIKEMVQHMVISHRPDHGSVKGGTKGPLHKESSYGKLGDGEKKGTIRLVTRKDIANFEKYSDLESIVDNHIRGTLQMHLHEYQEKTAFKERLMELSRPQKEGGEFTNGLRHVRVFEDKDPSITVGVTKPGEAEPYKYYFSGSNDHAEVYILNKGKNAGKWQVEVVSTYNAHQKDFIPNWRKEDPTAKKVMDLYNRDMVAYEDGEETKVCIVKKITAANNSIFLREHFVAKEEADKLSWGAYPNGLMQKQVRRLHVNILGHVRDPLGKVKYRIKDRIKAYKKSDKE